jgi:hypothetical protein
MTSGMTSGAEIMPLNSVRPLKRPKRTSARPASVPRIIAKEAFTVAIFRLSAIASQTSSLSNRTPYHLVEKPPQTGTILDLLNE